MSDKTDVEKFEERFPSFYIFKNGFERMAIEGLNNGFKAKSSHTSPMKQFSPLYDRKAYNIKNLRHIRVNDHPVHLTVVNVPQMSLQMEQKLHSGIRLCGLIKEKEGKYFLRDFGEIRFDLTLSNIWVSHQEDDMIVTLPSRSGRCQAFNTTSFFLISYSEDKTRVLLSHSFDIVNWETARRILNGELPKGRILRTIDKEYLYVKRVVFDKRKDRELMKKLKAFIEDNIPQGECESTEPDVQLSSNSKSEENLVELLHVETSFLNYDGINIIFDYKYI